MVSKRWFERGEGLSLPDRAATRPLSSSRPPRGGLCRNPGRQPGRFRQRSGPAVRLAAALSGLCCSAAVGAADLLLYSVKEPGSGPYLSRVIVTDRHLRMDDGADAGDFVLLDRESGTVYSVAHTERTIFTIPARPVGTEPPMALEEKSEAVSTDEPFPPVAGEVPRHYRLTVNGRACHDVVAVDLLPGAVAALRQLRRTLAGQRALSLPSLPADLQEPCDLAVNVFHSAWVLQFGLPIQEWSQVEERAHALLDFRDDFEADPALFRLPEGYEHFSTGE